MNTKLTLNINQNVIEEAKAYAKETRVSLSKLIITIFNPSQRKIQKNLK